MKKVLTVGVFDYFHYGHLRLFNRAAAFGDYLIVAVQDSDYILKYKSDAKIMYSTDIRCEMVGSLKVVDETVVYTDVDKIVDEIDFDVFVVGGDQNHAGFQKAIEKCRERGIEVVRLERTKGVCSSDIKNSLEK